MMHFFLGWSTTVWHAASATTVPAAAVWDASNTFCMIPFYISASAFSS
jgi:hypothetical protein